MVRRCEDDHGTCHSLAREVSSDEALALLVDRSTPDTEGRGRATKWQTILNILKTCLGTGLLGLPFACQRSGLILFTFGTFALAMWNACAVQRLCRCLDLIPVETGDSGNEKRRQYDTIIELFENSKKRDTSGPRPGSPQLGVVAWFSFGDVGLLLTDLVMAVLLFGILVAYMSATFSFLSDVPFTAGRLINAFIIANVTAIISIVPDVGHLSKTSATGLVILFFALAVIFFYGVVAFRAVDHAKSSLNLWPESMSAVSHWFGICLFGYGVVPLTYNYRSSMAEPTRVVEATAWALAIAAILYVTWATLICVLFGDVPGEILHELPQHGLLPSLVRMALVIMVLLTAPLLVVPCGELLEGRLHWAHPPIMRFAICWLSGGLACVFPSFVGVLSIVGCTCFGVVGFVMPPLFHFRLSTVACPDNVADVVLALCGIVSTVVGTSYLVSS